MESAVFQEWVKDLVEEKTAAAKQEAICQFLNDRFGDVSRDLRGRIKRIANVDTLDRILSKIFRAESLNDAGNVVEDATK